MPRIDPDQLELRAFTAADTDALWSLRNQCLSADDPLEVWRQRDSSPPLDNVSSG